MKSCRRIAVFIILILLTELLCAPAYALGGARFDDDEEADPDAAAAAAAAEEAAQDFVVYAENTLLPGETPAPDDDTYYVLDAEELTGLVEQFMKERGIQSDRFGVAFCYTGTGETWSYNGDMFMQGASLYKLSMNMGLAKLVHDGELAQTDKIQGMDIGYIEMRSLTYSDNDVSEKLITYFCNRLGSFDGYKNMQAEIAGADPSSLPWEYYHNNFFSPNFNLGALKELYAHSELYPNVLDCLYNANPGHYFRMTMDGKYTVAQKYGGGSGFLHTAGIIYTPTPILLVVMTRRVANAEYAIANMATLMTDYALTMDKRIQDHYDEIARQEEEARRAEEEARLAAEAEERARQEAEEAARRAEEEARLAAEEEARRAAEAAAQTPSPAPEIDNTAAYLGVLGYIVTAVVAAAVIMTVIGVVLLLRRRDE